MTHIEVFYNQEKSVTPGCKLYRHIFAIAPMTQLAREQWNRKDATMASVFDVAKYILEQLKTLQLCNDGACAMWKLHKLCYYAQAWALVWGDGQPLFQEEFEAWSNGPVCKDLYLAYKGFYLMDAVKMTHGNSMFLSEDERESVDVVLASYAHQAPYWLRGQTRSEAPWINARRGISETEHEGPVISKTSMLAYYGSL